MPRKPKKPCAHLGCPELVDNKTYCDKHEQERQQRQRIYKRKHDIKRAPSSQRGYDSRWRKIRKMKLARQPLCEECQKHGRVKQAEEVHHIVPISEGGSNILDNLESLCKICHNQKEVR